jgi:hypothetical protein
MSDDVFVCGGDGAAEVVRNLRREIAQLRRERDEARSTLLIIQSAEDERLDHFMDDAETDGAVVLPCSGCFEGGESGGRHHLYAMNKRAGERRGAGCHECAGLGLVATACPNE